ncbi:dTDP-4-dehydrorhamnose 3,5-epimerase [Runella slithyformis]|uniref:dTDP-4-dehydrorhamnose 3,5-epimerase n=1 Tax=Runella slithyformis (strain ATCC 29530 / DSM 19594 / LMG 11500 / NCIMB 11436 / LSU 4) TaxID=761193 RepID=A0A7U3ZPJ8_RUNSL|nr:dTDP-4-dehydrorhamnose 3,5-epimerase [Runella slithyformis]AEI51005.1 dTDP-4-dehydrorhamnose 3,5-epimerase [Runella slithyformis DSM 19594]
MNITSTLLKDVYVITPAIYADERGHFFESFNELTWKKKGLPDSFVQDNQSFSTKGVLRGLHFQTGEFAQGKLVRVIKGRVLDIAVDIRPDSPTFGKYEFFELDGETNTMVYIPEGFAHGFVALEDSIFSYKCTAGYNKASEGGIIWNDPTLKIQWPITNPIVSDKDKELPTFESLFDTLKAQG